MRRRLLLSSLLLLAFALGAVTPAPASGGLTVDPVIAAAGDIACDPNDPRFNGGDGTATHCHMKQTSDLLVAGNYTKVLTLGDNQYMNGALGKYQASYDLSWGRVKAITAPSYGNHDWATGNVQGSLDYFERTEPFWYSFEVGGWHVVSLDSNCSRVGGCGGDSPQGRWLKNDLANHPVRCTLAYWHNPRFSSDRTTTPMRAFWKILYNNNADVILNGHLHNYERFAPQNPNGTADPVRGIRQFVVGTGGVEQDDPDPFPYPRATSEARQVGTYGVLEMTLASDGYTFRFVPDLTSGTFTDAGTGRCH